MNGWIKLHKQSIENDIWQKDLVAWHIFEGLLMLCDTKSGTWAGGRFQLAQLLSIKPTTIYKALLRLQKAQMVTLSSNNKYTTISICKWKEYQGAGNTSGNNKVTTKGQQSNTLKRNKEIRYKEVSKDTIVSKLYYDYLKKHRIPITNHTTLKKKIKELEELNGTLWCENYLTFMLNEFDKVIYKYKPEINNYLDLFNKSKQVESVMNKVKIKQEIY